MRWLDYLRLNLGLADTAYCLIHAHRREHLSAEDLKKNKELLDSLSRGFFVENSCDQPCVRRESIQPPPPSPVSWDEYVTAPSGRWPHLGRPMVVKETRKSLKATVAMSEEFPIRLDRLLDVLEIIAPFKHFLKLREFVQLKLPSGFPVKIEIPVLPTITAKITFQDFQARDSDFYPESFFCIPNNFKEDPNRMDATLVDFSDMRWQRGDLSFIFNGHLRPNVSLVVLDNELKVFQRIQCEYMETAKSTVMDDSADLGPTALQN
uniref:Ankyrin repeat domain-containing protein n=1 Tax=Branchiostoma floridae TaxID=7739 RepID=C3YSZ2_BRAFL|eukprot:XP_002600548.1 hypothetical protein BRAFLDRAFT_70075 [Branchiostoma floridae]